MQRFDFYLKDILIAIEKIEKSLGGIEKEKFKRNTDLIDMTLMRIQVIGESINKIPYSVKRKYKGVEWEKAIVMRNLISHAYFKVNTETIWDIVKNELPKIKKEVEEIIKKEVN